MKALVVRQPWAGLIAAGVKRAEIRTRRTRHRGDLLIVAGKSRAEHAPLFDADADGPRGQAVAVVRVADCRPFTAADATAACIPWQPGLFAWLLADIRPIAKPFPVRGMPGLFHADPPPAAP